MFSRVGGEGGMANGGACEEARDGGGGPLGWAGGVG